MNVKRRHSDTYIYVLPRSAHTHSEKLYISISDQLSSLGTHSSSQTTTSCHLQSQTPTTHCSDTTQTHSTTLSHAKTSVTNQRTKETQTQTPHRIKDLIENM